MKKVWELYPNLTKAVRKDHEEQNCGHHPFEHALTVAQYCLIIADDERTGELSAIAGLLHNTDRIHPNATEEEVENRINELLLELENDDIQLWEEENLILDAVLNHSKKNDPSDSPVLVCLKDADRLANINPFDIIARASRLFSDLPLVDPKFVMEMDPASTHVAPITVFREAIHSTLEWETWLRLPKAQSVGHRYFEGLRQVQSLTQQQLAETGLNQYRP